MPCDVEKDFCKPCVLAARFLRAGTGVDIKRAQSRQREMQASGVLHCRTRSLSIYIELLLHSVLVVRKSLMEQYVTKQNDPQQS